LYTLWLSGHVQLRELIATVTKEGPFDREGFKVHQQRLRAGKIPGFEGPKLLNLKLNKKLSLNGESPIDLQQECPEDLAQRQEDQFQLYLELHKIYS